jgi:HEAT repeat protein
MRAVIPDRPDGSRPARRRPRPALAVALGLAAAALGGCTGGDLDSPDPARRAAAVRSLGGEPPERALPALLVAQADASPEVRLAAADALLRLGGARGAEGLGALLADGDAAVVAAAAERLARLPLEAGGKERLLHAYADAAPTGRAAIAAALDRMGVSLREAVEAESRLLWERHLAAIDQPAGVHAGQARAGAAALLGESGRAEAVARLVALVDGPGRGDARLLAAAARGLGASGHRSARPRLELLLESPVREVAEGAADGVRALGDPAAADALAALAEKGGPAAAAALSALESLPQAPEVGAALCAVAVRTPEPGRAAAAARLATLRDAGCPERPLLGRLGRPGELSALAALAELRLEPPAAEAAGRRVLALLQAGRGDAPVRVAAARALGGLGWKGGAGPALERCTVLLERIEAGRAKVASAGPPAAPAATPFAETPDAEELGALVAAAARLGAADAGPLARRLLGDPSAAVRAGAVEALGWLRDGAAVAAASAALEDAASAVRRAAARTLGRLGPPGAAPLVGAAARTRPADGGWRQELAQALGETGSPDAVGGLAALLDGESTGQAAQALARLGASAGARPLSDLVARPGAAALPEAIEALAHVAGPEAGPVIAAHLTSDRADVREAAVRALGQLRYEPASPRLEAMRSDYYGRIRRAAVEAIAKLPSRRPGRP